MSQSACRPQLDKVSSTPLKFEERQLLVFDSTRLRDEPHFLNLEFLLLSKLKGPRGFLSGRKGAGQILVFDSAGELKFYFNKTESEHFKLPEGVPVGYEYSPTDSSIYIVFPYDQELLKINHLGELVSTLSLELPSDYEFTSQPHLFIGKSGEIVVSLGYKNYRGSAAFYEKSPLFGLFDRHGKFVRVFGTYPENLKDGKLADLSSTIPALYHALPSEKGIFIAFNHSPEVSLYDWSGQLINTWQFESPTMDYLDHTEAHLSPGRNANIDMIFSLAVSPQVKHIYQIFSTQSQRRKYGKIPQTYLFTVNTTDSTASEINLTKAFPKSLLTRMLPWTQGDTLMFVIQNSDDENFYLYKAMMENQ